MADFNLKEVAKRGDMSAESALKKLRDAGEQVSGVDATISVEQMRILGVTPQQMLDSRKERLQQIRDRKRGGGMGKEIVMNSRTKEEPAPVSMKISKEELQKRKSELNKVVQRVDEDRLNRQKNPEEPQNTPKSAETEENIPVAEIIAPIITEKETVKIEEEKTITEAVAVVAEILEPTPPPPPAPTPPPAPLPKPKPEQTIKKEFSTSAPAPKRESPAPTPAPAPVAPAKPSAPTPRPLGPAGYVPPPPRGQRSGGGEYRRPTGPQSQQNRGQQGDRPYQRPTGPAAGSGGQQRTWQNRDGGTGGGGRPAGGRASGGFTPRTETTIAPRPEEGRRWEDKKAREPEVVVAKEEAKKPKIKGDIKKAKDWTKIITEGVSELNIESEIGKEGDAVAEVPVAEVIVRPKTDRRQHKQRKHGKETPPPTPRPTSVTIGENIAVSELAGEIGIKATELVKKLFGMGIMATVNQAITAEVAELLCLEYGVEVTTKIITEDDLLPAHSDKPEDMQPRPPVVTVMGHVDHGKTSLLDAIRSTSVVEREAGGITQHIGAYEVELDGRKITFLDTPGHEAFTSLRARGAQVTDIVILVVAANDGVMPQTKEAIDHAKAAGVRIVVAVNKMDRPDANPDKVRQQLADHGIISEDWGGEQQFQEISAKKRTNIKELLERVLLEADVLELKGNPNRPAEGIIIESHLDKHKGPVATVLVKSGTLKRGDTFIVGSQIGKVRSMYNYTGQVVREAKISTPVEVMGISFVPKSGDTMVVVEDENIARKVVEIRARQEQHLKHTTGGAVSLSDFFNKVKAGVVKELNIIIKADVQGSLEALKTSLQKLSNVEVKVNVVHDATGGITESDVVLAVASKAIIIGFNVRPDNNAKNFADKEGVDIELYSVIYKAIEDVKLAMEGMLTPDTKENVIGKVEVRQVFSVPKLGKIAGAYVQEGKVTRNSLLRVIRDNVVMYEGKIGSLKRFTDDAKEVLAGYECGLSIEKYQDIKEKDILEIYEVVQEKRTLEDVR